MTAGLSIANVLILTTAGIALLSDLKTGHIPNVLVVTAAVTGLFYQCMYLGIKGGLNWAAGLSVPAVLLMPLFRFRMMGAGDIKLLMGLGGIVGFPEILDLMLWSVAAGGVIAFFRMFFAAGFRGRFTYLLDYIRQTATDGIIRPYRKPGRRPENFPFALPVFAAVMILLCTRSVY